MMAGERVPTREEIAKEHTWNAESVFASVQAWEEACVQLEEKLEVFSGFQGRLKDGADVLSDALTALEDLLRDLGMIRVYAGISTSVDSTNQAAAGRYSKSLTLYGKAQAISGFFDPELIAIGRETLERWMKDRPHLSIMTHYVDDLFRRQKHVRSAEIEQLLGMLVDPFSSVSGTARLLTSADFRFDPAIDSDGNQYDVTQGNYTKLLASSNRNLRKTTWQNYHRLYSDYRNTLANNLATSIKQNVFTMRARNHNSTLEAALFELNIPVTVFHTLIDTFRKNLPTWHRYWAVRRKALKVDTLHPYDTWAPLTDARPKVEFRQAVDWICEGLEPMGKEYVDVLRKGCLEDRWIDIYPNVGKRGGAFSSGSPGTHPFVMMSYNDTVFSLSTLAHELGHSMHSYLAWQNQPVLYGDYSLFVAEVASNFNQAMVRAYLLENNRDPDFQISVIEEAMANFYRYFLVMPTLARFELEMHERVERGEGLTADLMIRRMTELYREACGDEMHVDEDSIGILWATFGHLYVDYYVYAYATGLSGAHALANRVRSGEGSAAEDCLKFFRAGGSAYPLQVLQMAGVDLTTPDPIEETFGVLADMVTRLEELLP